MSAIHLEINFFLSSLTIPIFASRIKIQFWKEKIHFIQKNIENKLVSDNLKEIRKKGCSLLSQYYHVIPVHIDIPITQHALMLAFLQFLVCPHFCPLCALLLPYLHVSLVILMPSSCPPFAFTTFMQNEDKWRAFEMTCEICNYGNRWAQRGQK